jgi:RNA polymerase sigma-70 factor (ECF subfamily)
MTEQEITAGCKKGDNKARKELYEQYKGKMYALILRYMPDRDVARDVLHDGFIAVFTRFDRFEWRQEGSLRAWISRLFVNEVLQHLRAKDILRDTVDIGKTLETFSMPEDINVESIPSNILHHFISELPTGYRTVFNLFALDGLSHKEIGMMLNISEHTSSSQFYRAKQIIARKISEYRKRVG